MPKTKYTYSVTNDTLNAAVNLTSLQSEITAAEIITAIERIDRSSDVLDVWFKSALTPEDQTLLSNIVAAHTGSATVEEADPTYKLMTWDKFKDHVITKKKIPFDYYFVEDKNHTFAYASSEGITFYTEIPADTDDAAEFDALYASKANQAPYTGSGKQKVALYKSEDTAKVAVTHDWCDKTTWFQGSLHEVDDVLTVDSGTTYRSSHSFWIDLTHGRMYDEFTINADNKYTPIIKVDGVVVSDDTYTIHYITGLVEFEVAPAGEITATYYYAGSSTYTLAPTPGKKLYLEHSEMQFTKDVIINYPLNFEIWVYNPADLPNKVKYRHTKYKNGRDFINSCNKGQGLIPSFDNISNDVLVFPFEYVTMIPLDSAVGAELRIYMDEDNPITGEFATCSFYCISTDS